MKNSTIYSPTKLLKIYAKSKIKLKIKLKKKIDLEVSIIPVVNISPRGIRGN